MPKKKVEYDSSDEEGKRASAIMSMVTEMRNRGETVRIQWNARGQPFGKHADTFMMYMALVARSHVFAGISNRKRVPNVTKEVIWEEITQLFVIPEEKRKWCLKHCVKWLKTYRSCLDRKNQHKKDIMIEQKKVSCTSSRLGNLRKNARHMTLMIQEAADELKALEQSDSTEDPHQYSVPSSVTRKKEHPRQLRGIGSKDTKRSFCGRAPRSQRTNPKMLILKKKLELLTQEMASINDGISIIESQRYMPSRSMSQDPLHIPIVDSISDSCGSDAHLSSHSRPLVSDAPLPIPTEELITVGDAHGSFVAWPTSQIHLTTVKENICTSKETAYHTLKRQKAGKGKVKSVQSMASFAPPLPPNIVFDDESLATTKIMRLRMLYLYATNFLGNDHFDVNVPSQIIGYDANLFIGIECINEVYHRQWMSIMSIAVYVKSVGLLVQRESSPFSLVCPYFLNDSTNLKEGKNTIYLSERLFQEGSHKLVLIPHLAKSHWVLYAYHPLKNIVYMFDSFPNDQISFNQCHVNGKAFMKMAIWKACCMKQGKDVPNPNSVQYVLVKSPVHTNNIDCGYYVCRNMLEIVRRKSDIIDPNNFSAAGSTKLPYTDEEIDEIRDQWARVIYPAEVLSRM